MRMTAIPQMKLLVFMVLLFGHFSGRVRPQTQTMCLTQISLANQVCSLLPLRTSPKEHKEMGNYVHGHKHRRGSHDDDDDNDDDDDDDKDGQGHKRRHRQKHVRERVHEHHRRHKHHHSHLREECCRWLEEIDSACVCQVLTRLPKFLTRPKHNYTLAVGDTCRVGFECEGF